MAPSEHCVGFFQPAQHIGWGDGVGHMQAGGNWDEVVFLNGVSGTPLVQLDASMHAKELDGLKGLDEAIHPDLMSALNAVQGALSLPLTERTEAGAVASPSVVDFRHSHFVFCAPPELWNGLNSNTVIGHLRDFRKLSLMELKLQRGNGGEQRFQVIRSANSAIPKERGYPLDQVFDSIEEALSAMRVFMDAYSTVPAEALPPLTDNLNARVFHFFPTQLWGQCHPRELSRKYVAGVGPSREQLSHRIALHPSHEPAAPFVVSDWPKRRGEPGSALDKTCYPNLAEAVAAIRGQTPQI
ncbi:MAG: hypothetical protein WC777_01610 [Candidatus Gracilibacteria bacterium]|jgi:hypothetical protein